MSLDRYFDSIREYVPEDAKAVLDRQIPAIRDEVKRSVDDFGKQLGDFVHKRIADLTIEQEREARDARVQYERALGDLKTQAGVDPAKIAALEQAITAYEERWRGLGEKIKGAALLAVRSTGIPIPGL